MKTSARGIEDLILSEGIRLKAYRDSVGVWTIGCGHAATSGTAPIPKAGMVITKAEAYAILARDLAKFEVGVNAVLPNVPQHVFDGAVSFHFNTGGIARASWVGHYKAGRMSTARAAFMTWKKPPEIIGRRTREAELIFEGKYRSGPASAPSPVPAPTIPILPRDPLLRKGDGYKASDPLRPKIAEAQLLLGDRGFRVPEVDGIFGPDTEARVRAFQRQRGLTDDGVIGSATWAELRTPNPMQAEAPIVADGLGVPVPEPQPEPTLWQRLKGYGGRDRL